MDGRSLCILFMVTTINVIAHKTHDAAQNQLIMFKKKHPHPILLTTAAGKPVEYKKANSTLNKKLIYNDFFMEYILQLGQEKIPERVVHSKAAGAFGYFEVTHNISDICKAKLFNHVGKRTPIAVRLSIARGATGSSDTIRAIRGFAVKFYTEDGNWDFLGINVPVFQIKDPILFPMFNHAVKKNPATNVNDDNMFWDMFTLHPESLHSILYVFGDKGIPDGYRHMFGFSVHTYQVVNDAGESFFVRFKFSPDAGIKNIYLQKAKKLSGEEPDYAVKDLYNAIAEGNFPSWTCYIQVLTEEDVNNAKFDVFDLTRILPEDKYPLRPFGRIVLNQNPVNVFAEIEQLAFGPINLVPGILGAPDKVFEARCMAYRAAQNYRLGVNFFNIPVNCPVNAMTHTYNRDGRPSVSDNERDAPNYYPNSFNGPKPYLEDNRAQLIEIYESSPYNLDQSQDLYNSFTPGEKKRLVKNIASTLKFATSFIQKRAIKLFSLINVQLGQDLKLALHSNSTTS